MRPIFGGSTKRWASFAAAVSVGLAVMAAPAYAVDAHPGNGVCLEIDARAVPAEAWPLIVEDVVAAARARPELFPELSFIARPDPADAAAQPSTYAIELSPEPATAGAGERSVGCLRPDAAWTVSIGRSFLDRGADRMLEQAPTTPGIDSTVEVEWYPDEVRLRTRLHFAGPLDVPNGVCWIDDTLHVDIEQGRPATTAERGVETSLFAEGACGRFFDHLVNGGAGEQAITLLPRTFESSEGAAVQLETEQVTLDDEAVVLAGTISTR